MRCIEINPNISNQELSEEIVKISQTDKEYLDLKVLSKEQLIQAYKVILKIENNKNQVLLLNLLNVIKTYNDYDSESFFNNKLIYISSIMDYLDIRIALQDEIQEFQNKLAIYFYSLFRSLDKAEYTILDPYITIPSTFYSLLRSSDLITISGIISRTKFTSDDLLYVTNALDIVESLSDKLTTGSFLISSILGNK